jgi:hypothetical protein
MMKRRNSSKRIKETTQQNQTIETRGHDEYHREAKQDERLLLD